MVRIWNNKKSHILWVVYSLAKLTTKLYLPKLNVYIEYEPNRIWVEYEFYSWLYTNRNAYTHKNVRSNTTCRSPEPDTTNGILDLSYVRTVGDCPAVIMITASPTRNVSQMDVKLKKPNQEYTLCDSLYIKISNRQH